MIEAKELAIGYRAYKNERLVASGLNFTLPDGRLTALLGPNGSGKSTLIRTLSCLQPVMAGDVLLDGVSLSSRSRVELSKRLSIVLQEPIRGTHLSVFELVALGRIPHTNRMGNLAGPDLEKVYESLDATGITALSTRKISQLSDGELQRAMIAKALAQETHYILLDEPTAHLDVLGKIELIDKLRSLTTSKTILFSTHDVELALQMADHIWLIDENGTVKTGAPEDLVLEGSIGNIYSRNQEWGFDNQTGHILVPLINRSEGCSVEGSGLAYEWTLKALKRTGYAINTGSGTAGPTIRVAASGARPQWMLLRENNVLEARSIQQLLDLLASGS